MALKCQSCSRLRWFFSKENRILQEVHCFRTSSDLLWSLYCQIFFRKKTSNSVAFMSWSHHLIFREKTFWKREMKKVIFKMVAKNRLFWSSVWSSWYVDNGKVNTRRYELCSSKVNFFFFKVAKMSWLQRILAPWIRKNGL